MTKQQLLEGAKTLPEAERIDLAMELWEMIDPGTLPTAQPVIGELNRRAALDDADGQPARPWAEVRAELLRGVI